MSFCDISFNRKSGVVTDVLNKEGRESALYPQLVSYVQQDPQTVYDSKKEYFDTLVDQGKLVDNSTGELSLGLYSIAYNSGRTEQEFMDRINRDGNLSVFGVGGQQVFNQTVPVQQVSVEQERKLKNVAYEHFGLQGYLDYITDEDKYNVPWVKSFVGEAMIVFAGSDATREQLDKEKQKITDRVKEKERKVEQIYRQYLEQGGDVNSLKQFRHYVESEQYVLVDESGITQTGLDTNLSQKIQNLMQEKYPEIKLDITNTPVWEQEGNIFNQEEYISQVNYRLKAIEILSSDKAKQIFDKGKKAGWSLDKILTELQIPKEQKKIILDLNITDRDAIVVELATSYSYDVQIDIKPTTAYSELSVPGGTKYTEIEIATPAIIPSIQGHAQFATDSGIGWFRSDEKLPENYYGERGLDWKYENDNKTIKHTTRRILEVQSDLFQKGRDKESLTYSYFENEQIQTYRDNIKLFKEKGYTELAERRQKELDEILNQDDKLNKNQFLQLLNKDNNWVNFFVKSIIQDSAKKGYEKVLFPSGNTASKVEGHTTLEEFKKQKEDRIKKLEKENEKLLLSKEDEFADKIAKSDINAQIAREKYLSGIDTEVNQNNKEITQLKQELARIDKEGFGALRPIYNFYENTVANILKKQGYSPVQITDEYGNTWNEVTINQNRDLQNVLLQRDDSRRIIGQANIKAMTVLIDAVNQKQDTLPHEYAHHYIAWFRNTPMVRQAISQWGSEEALVQAIGEQVVAQKGEALNWWKRFVRLILSMFGKVSNNDRENIKNMLTNAFLEGRDLQTGQVGISRERSKELAEKAMEKPPLPQSTEEFISETIKSYNKQNALYAKRLESLLKEYPVKLEQAGASGMIVYNPQTKTVVVPLSVDDVFQNQVQKEILNQLMVGVFDQAVKQKIPRYNKNEVIARGYPYTFTRMQVESLKERYGKGIELKNYFNDVIDFVTGYMTDPELFEWAQNRLFPQKMAIEKMAEFISTSVFGKPILKNSVEEYLNTIWLRKSYDKPITNNNIDEIVSEIEEYGVIEGNYKESKVKVKERVEEAANLINEIYRAYGEKVSDFVFMSEGPDGTLTITVNRGKITEYQEEIKNQTRENIAANNKYQIEEVERKKETDIVDAVGYLDYLSDEDKRLAQIFIERGDFPLQCGI